MTSLIRGILLCICASVTVTGGCSAGAEGPETATAAGPVLTADGMVTLPATGFGDPGVTTSAPPAGWATGTVAWCCTTWWTPLTVAPGDVIGSVAALVRDVAPDPLYIPGSAGDGGSSVVLSLVAQVGPTETVLRTTSSNGSGTTQSLIMTLAQPYTVPMGAALLLKAQAFALWPSIVMHQSMIGPISTHAPVALGADGPPTQPLLSATTYLTVPGTSFAHSDIHVGVNGQVAELPVSTGRLTGVSISAQCVSGFIVACLRVRERGTWDWCGPVVACPFSASATVPLPVPLTLGATQHADIALMSGPSVATAPFAVYTMLP